MNLNICLIWNMCKAWYTDEIQKEAFMIMVEVLSFTKRTFTFGQRDSLPSYSKFHIYVWTYIDVPSLIKMIINYFFALTYGNDWELSFIDHILTHNTVLNVSLHWIIDTFPKCEHLNTYTLCFVTWICQNYIFNSIWIKISQYLRMECVYLKPLFYRLIIKWYRCSVLHGNLT